MQKQSLRYFFINFRTKRDYLIFQICQLTLALVIIWFALSNPNHFKSSTVLWMEFILLLSMAFDLFIIRYLSEGSLRALTKGFMGKIDIIVFIIFAVTLIFLAINNENDDDEILETDDILIILIVIGRYAVQIYRMVTSIKQTKQTREINRQIKEINLNVQDNVSMVYHTQIQNENALKDKITKNFKKNNPSNLVEQQDN